MKTETMIFLIIAGVILYKYAQPSQPGHTVDCSQPGADPIMCAWIEEHQAAAGADLLSEMMLA